MNRIAIEHGKVDVPFRFCELHWEPHWTIDDVKEHVKIEGESYIRPTHVLTDSELERFLRIGSGMRCNGDIRDFFFKGDL